MKTNKRQIKKLLTQHMKLAERAKALFKQAGACLDMALALHPPLNEPINLREGKQVIIKDHFATSNSVFRGKVFNRYEVDEVKRYGPKSKAKEESEVAA